MLMSKTKLLYSPRREANLPHGRINFQRTVPLHLCSDWGPKINNTKAAVKHTVQYLLPSQGTQSAASHPTPTYNYDCKGLQSGYVQYIELVKISGACSAVKPLAKQGQV